MTSLRSACNWESVDPVQGASWALWLCKIPDDRRENSFDIGIGKKEKYSPTGENMSRLYPGGKVRASSNLGSVMISPFLQRLAIKLLYNCYITVI